VIDYSLVTVSAREVWTTVARGGDWCTSIEYHNGRWTFSAPEVHKESEWEWPDVPQGEAQPGTAPVGLGYPLAGVPRGTLVGRTVDEEGRPGEPFLVGKGRTVGPFPHANPGYFLIQVTANILNPMRARGAIRVRVRRLPSEEQTV